MGKLLERIESPGDLKGLSINQLYKLAGEIRKFIITTVADTGGHLASNLGVVELTLALHYHLNSPVDKIIWDVGHQSYPHKILTGRQKEFNTIRQYHGLSGYPKCKESNHDIIETGHSSTSISAALGLALARDLKNRDDRIFSVIGDGALTAGMAFEALNHAGHLGTKMSVILNDNGMSISQNVGALSHYLSNIRTDPRIHKMKEDLEFIISKIPRFGTTVSRSVERVKDGFKYIFLSGILFEEMGFTYIGPLDGHNIKELINNFKKADVIDGPVLIHVNTKKGKGYQPAEKQPTKYHGVSPFQINNGESKKKKDKITFSKIFGQTMVRLANDDTNITSITAAMPEGTGLDIFKKKFSDRFFDVGIAEQHAVTLASGLAKGGKKPVVAIYSTFLQRAYDQVLHDVCLPDLPVTLAIDRSGIVGNDGETHQGTFDISFLRPIPNLVIMSPRDENQLQHMLYTAVNLGKPVAVRYPRGKIIGVEFDNSFKKIPVGSAEVLKNGKDVLILTIGTTVYASLSAAEILEKQGINVGVIDTRFIKPLDNNLLIKEIKKYKKIVTIEEHVLAGGFGSSILELINNHNLGDIELKRIGLPDHFIPHGSQQKMRSIYNLDARGIANTIIKLVSKEVELPVCPRKNA